MTFLAPGSLLIGLDRPAVVGIDRRPASPQRPRSAEYGSMERLEFRLLGFPEFRLNGRRVELALRKAAALLIYLAEAGGPVAREVAATLLWPETDEEAARARLRRTLHKSPYRVRQRGHRRHRSIPQSAPGALRRGRLQGFRACLQRRPSRRGRRHLYRRLSRRLLTAGLSGIRGMGLFQARGLAQPPGSGAGATDRSEDRRR